MDSSAEWVDADARDTSVTLVRDGRRFREVLAWTGDKRVRISTHLYNGIADVSQAIEAVKAVRNHGGKGEP